MLETRGPTRSTDDPLRRARPESPVSRGFIFRLPDLIGSCAGQTQIRPDPTHGQPKSRHTPQSWILDLRPVFTTAVLRKILTTQYIYIVKLRENLN